MTFDNGAPAATAILHSVVEHKHAPNGVIALLCITTILKVPSGLFYLLQVKIFCGSDAHFKIVFNFFTEPASELWIIM
jgi:hypothetical protein